MCLAQLLLDVIHPTKGGRVLERHTLLRLSLDIYYLKISYHDLFGRSLAD